MKAFSIRERSKKSLSIWLRAAGVALVGVIAIFVTRPSLAVTLRANAEVGSAQEVVTEAPHSAGVGEVLKMLDAKVDSEVVKAYIRNSSTAYNPNAAEIITLKERGVPGDILVAMLQRGGELRGQAGQPAPAVTEAPGTVPPYRAGMSPQEQQQSYPMDQGYSDGGGYYPYYSSYAYPYYSYGYPYYYGGYYGGYWPYYAAWPFYFGFCGWGGYYCGYPYYHNGCFHSHSGHSFAVHHNGSSVAVHGSSVAVHGGSSVAHVNSVNSVNRGSFASATRSTTFASRSGGGFSSGMRSSTFASRSFSGGSGFASRSVASGGMGFHGGSTMSHSGGSWGFSSRSMASGFTHSGGGGFSTHGGGGGGGFHGGGGGGFHGGGGGGGGRGR